MKGLIALDIDGTITTDLLSVPEKVVTYLTHLYNEGWAFAFVTGRPFNWSFPILRAFPFPFYLAMHNGALILQMPEQKIISRAYISHNHLAKLEKICRSFKTDFVIYSGFENSDRCFYRPGRFPSDVRGYLEARMRAYDEEWLAVDSFSDIEVKQYPSLKCFGKEIELLADAIKEEMRFCVPVIQDHFDKAFSIGQIADAHKGSAISRLRGDEPVIAAGDERNDFEMLQEANVRIVMDTAPDKLREIADYIAPPAKELGIIEGLEFAIRRCT